MKSNFFEMLKLSFQGQFLDNRKVGEEEVKRPEISDIGKR